MLDERKSVSYPDGQQEADGSIRIIYDYDRTGERQILMATFREADIEAKKILSRNGKLRQHVSDASGGLEK
ncbi:MAG: exo-alpha-sialidase [Planctomycetota bacterium]|nr:exo-alpha-sialidase [Planctomycetota bacterium]MEC8557071.1 exo-alpha-sialidase [Planctomycetota bacterium]